LFDIVHESDLHSVACLDELLDGAHGERCCRIVSHRAHIIRRSPRTKVEKNGSHNDHLDGQGSLFFLLLDFSRALLWWCLIMLTDFLACHNS